MKVDITGNSVKVFQNNANIGSLSLADFATTYTFATAASPKDVLLADMNNDGLLDILVSTGGTTLSILINNSTSGGSISFLAKQDITVASTKYIKVADLNQDGLPDLMTMPEYSSSINIYRNTSTLPNSTLSFASVVSISTTARSRGNLDIGDLNNDGLIDIVLAGESGPAGIYVNSSTSNIIAFNSPITLSSTGGRPVKIADLNMDGKNDILIGKTNTIDIYQNIYTTGTFDQSSFNPVQQLTSVTSSASNNPWNLDVADIDGDGKPDIAFGDFNSQSYVILVKNTNTMGAGTTISNTNFAVFKYIDVLSLYGSTFLSDLDLDGKPDYVAMSLSLIAVGRSRIGETIDFYPKSTSLL